MKQNVRCGLAVVFALVLGLLAGGCVTRAPEPRPSYSLPDLVGVWEGSYSATQGETGLTLTVFEDNGVYRATFYFYHLPGKTDAGLLPEGVDGSYYMTVTANDSTRKYNLVGDEWISIPNTPGASWSFVDLEGIVHGNVFTGNAMGLGSTLTFRVARQ